MLLIERSTILMPTIALITTAFPPSPEVGALRTVKLTAALRAQGWTPVVIAPDSWAYTAPRDRYGRPAAPLPLPGEGEVAVFRVGSFNPIVFAGHLRRGASEDVAVPPQLMTVPAHRRNWRGVLTQAVTKMMIPDEYMFWVRAASDECVAQGLAHGASAVLASFPAAGALMAGVRASRRLSVPLIVDYRDPWEYYGPAYEAGPLRSRIEKHVRSRIVRSASAAIAVSEDILNRNLAGLHADHLKTAVLPQGWDPHESSLYSGVKPKSMSDGVLRIVHAGTVYPHSSDPEPFLKVISELVREGWLDPREIRLLFVGHVLMDIEQIASKHGVGEVVEIRGVIPRGDLLHVLAETDFLLLLRHREDRSFISGKVWDYLTAGRPIFAVVNPDSEAANLIQRSRVGIVAEAGNIVDIRARLIEMIDAARQGAPFEPDAAELDNTTTPAIGRKLVELLEQL